MTDTTVPSILQIHTNKMIHANISTSGTVIKKYHKTRKKNCVIQDPYSFL